MMLGTSYWSARESWARQVTNKANGFWSVYNADSDFQWCNLHGRHYLPQVKKNAELNIECRVCTDRSDPILSIQGSSDEIVIAGYRKLWEDSKARLNDIKIKTAENMSQSASGSDSNDYRLEMAAKEELTNWAQYEISVWNLGQLLKQKYSTDTMMNKLPAVDKWTPNKTISSYQVDCMVRKSDLSANRAGVGSEYDGLIHTPNVTYCRTHDSLGEGVPFRNPHSYKPECFTCLRPRKQIHNPVAIKAEPFQKSDNDGRLIYKDSLLRFSDENLPSKNRLNTNATYKDNLLRSPDANQSNKTRTNTEYKEPLRVVNTNTRTHLSSMSMDTSADATMPPNNYYYNNNNNTSSSLSASSLGGLPSRGVKKLNPGQMKF